jgi:outer membrane protein TolC
LVQQERLFVRSQLELKSYVVDRLNKNGHEFSLQDIPEVEITKKVDPQVLEKINAQVDDLEVALKQPEVQRQQLILDQSRMDLSLAKNQFLPKLDFQLIGSRDLGVDVYPLSKFQSDAGVVFEFPIPSRAASARIEQSSASVIRQESQFEISKMRVLNSIKESKFALTTASTRLDYSFTELELAQKLADLENKRFLAGDSNLLLLNIREQNLAEAEIRKFEAYADLEKATNDYRVSTGDLKTLRN